jgi:putative ABC transport system substrate-binding protein
VIFTAGSAVFAAKQATSSIPVVFAVAPDPIGDGLVDSLARPGGNVTGLSNQQAEVAGKRVELLREVVPGLSRLAIMVNINNPGAAREASTAAAAARSIGLEIVTLQIRRAEDIVPAFEAIKDPSQALYVCSDFLSFTYRVRLNTMALALRLPTIFGERENVEAAGLMSYGPNFPDLFRRAAELVNKILRGTKPADIPVEQPTKFDLVVNLTTAKALGLNIPATVYALADEVIE